MLHVEGQAVAAISGVTIPSKRPRQKSRIESHKEPPSRRRPVEIQNTCNDESSTSTYRIKIRRTSPTLRRLEETSHVPCSIARRSPPSPVVGTHEAVSPSKRSAVTKSKVARTPHAEEKLPLKRVNSTLASSPLQISHCLTSGLVAPPMIYCLGPPCFQIYHSALPTSTLPVLARLKQICDEHASGLPTGWRTCLYSLTKQDIAINDIPAAREAVVPITRHIMKMVEKLSGQRVRLDWNQPHVLKYDGSHQSVPLHYDICDVTVNVMLSECGDYEGGGTYLPAIGTTVRLPYGNILIHPGNALHAGCEIHSGSRYLLVYFCKFC
jgi:hypothetical protein